MPIVAPSSTRISSSSQSSVPCIDAVRVRRSRALVVDEHHAVADEDPRPDPDAGADEGMTLDLAARTDLHTGLDLDERADPRSASDRAAVEVGEAVNDDSIPEPAVPDERGWGPRCWAARAQGQGNRPGSGRAPAGAGSTRSSAGEARAAGSGPTPTRASTPAAPGLLKRSPLGRRILIQAVKRSPLDLAPAARHRAGARRRLRRPRARRPRGRADGASRFRRGGWAIDRLLELRVPGFAEPCWGYHFDVETRFFYYPRTHPEHDRHRLRRPGAARRPRAHRTSRPARARDAESGTS